jgi:phosphoserine phosphatase
VENPFYAQLQFALARVVALAPQHPEWKTTQPFQAVLMGDKAAMAKFTMKDLQAILVATHTGMTADQFSAVAKAWLASAKHKRWERPYTDLVYQPMLEVMRYLRANGYRVYFVTGGGQAFVRTYAEKVYGVPPERVIGSALETQYTYDAAGDSILMRVPKLLLFDDKQGKPQNIYLFTGRHPTAAFGNSSGDREMLEYTQAGGGQLMMLVLHDDAQRENAYGPAKGLPQSKIGTFPQSLYDEATAKGWIVVSMKNDWRRIFTFEK